MAYDLGQWFDMIGKEHQAAAFYGKAKTAIEHMLATVKDPVLQASFQQSGPVQTILAVRHARARESKPSAASLQGAAVLQVPARRTATPSSALPREVSDGPSSRNWVVIYPLPAKLRFMKSVTSVIKSSHDRHACRIGTPYIQGCEA